MQTIDDLTMKNTVSQRSYHIIILIKFVCITLVLITLIKNVLQMLLSELEELKKRGVVSTQAPPTRSSESNAARQMPGVCLLCCICINIIFYFSCLTYRIAGISCSWFSLINHVYTHEFNIVCTYMLQKGWYSAKTF